MSEHTTFSDQIVFSDIFLDLPFSARCLYFALGMSADNEGFTNRPKCIIREIGASTDDLELLIEKGFIVRDYLHEDATQSGIIVVLEPMWRKNEAGK